MSQGGTASHTVIMEDVEGGTDVQQDEEQPTKLLHYLERVCQSGKHRPHVQEHPSAYTSTLMLDVSCRVVASVAQDNTTVSEKGIESDLEWNSEEEQDGNARRSDKLLDHEQPAENEEILDLESGLMDQCDKNGSSLDSDEFYISDIVPLSGIQKCRNLARGSGTGGARSYNNIKRSLCLNEGLGERKTGSVLFGTDKADPLERDISRTELERIFQEKAGVLVSEGILDEIFQKADTDGNGSLCPRKVTAYINNIKRKSHIQRRFSVLKKALGSFAAICSLSFFFGSLSAVSTNLRQRSFGDLFGVDTHYYNQISGWLLQFGALGFVAMVYAQEKLQFHRYRNTYRKLARWIRWDLPSEVEKNMSEHGLPILTTIGHEAKSRTSIGTFVRENSERIGDSFMDHINDERLCPMQLRVLLESMGTFLFHDELKHVFSEICRGSNDVNKKASLKDLMDFAQEKERYLTDESVSPLRTLIRAARSVSFWTSLAYVVGSIPIWLVDFIDASPKWSFHLNGFTCLCYSLGALGGLPTVWNSSRTTLLDRKQLDEKLRSIAIKLGMLTSYFDKSRIRMSSVRNLSNQHLRGLERNKIQAYQKRGAPHIFELASVKEDDLLDSAEFYSIVSDLGISMAVVECETLWKRIGPNQENKIQTAKLIEYIRGIDPDSATSFCSVFLNMVTSLSFVLALFGVTASTLHSIAAYVPLDADTVSNLYLAGSVGWALSSFVVLNEAILAAGRQHDMLQESKFLLKDAIVAASNDIEYGDGRVSITDVAAELVSSGVTSRDKRVDFLAQPQISKHSSRLLADLARALSEAKDMLSSSLNFSRLDEEIQITSIF